MVGFLNVLTGVIIFVYLMFFVLSDPAIIILGAIAFLEYVTLSSIIDLRLTYTFSFTLLSSSLFSASFVFGAGLDVFRFFPLIFVFLVIFTGLAHILMLSMSSRLRITKKTDPFALLRAYLFLQLRRDRSRIDREFEKFSIEREIPIAITLFENKDNKPILILVGAIIHPGPMLLAGSSDFPYVLSKELSKTFGCPVIFMKGACSHESNLPSLREQIRILNVIKGHIMDLMENEAKADMISHPKVFHHNSTHITMLNFGNLLYLITSNAPEMTEDLKVDLGYAAIEMGKLLSKNVFLVDAHNSLDDPTSGFTIDTDDPLYLSNIEAITKAIKLDLGDKKEFRVGSAITHCEDITLEDGLGDAGISVFVIEIENKKHIFVVYDSNNITPDLYLEVKKRLKERFEADIVEIMSTDTHTVCAVNPDVMYTILGKKKFEKIVKHTEETVKKAIQNLQPAKLKSDMLTMRAKVLGEKNISVLKSLAVSGIRTAVIDLIRMYIIATLLSIIIYLTI